MTDDKKEEVITDEGKQGKTFTQEEVNGIVTKESRKAIEKILKDLGVEDVKNAKEGLSKLKELQDKDKTELEKAQGEIETLTKQLEEATGKITGGETKVALLGAGVPADKLDKYTKLYNVTDGETAEDKIKALMEEFPIAPVAPTEPPPNLGGQTGSGNTAKTMEQMQAEMDAIAGVK